MPNKAISKKQCKKCGKKLPLTAFGKSKSTTDGLRGSCKECILECQRAYYRTKKGRANILKSCKKRYDSKEGKKASRSYSMKRKYGITLEQYDEMFETQDGVCAICHKSETAKCQTDTVRRLSVDHDHKTGEARALLCSRCNFVIGYAREDAIILLNAGIYLEECKNAE